MWALGIDQTRSCPRGKTTRRGLTGCCLLALVRGSRLAEVSVSPVVRGTTVVFLVDRPGRALPCERPEVRFCCCLLAALLLGLAELPGRARFRQLTSFPLEPMMGRFRAPSGSFKTSLLSLERSSPLTGVCFVSDTRRRR